MATLALQASRLCKRYGELSAVEAVSFQVRHGEIVGLLGPNGAGKTTTNEICEGLLAPDDGEVEILGMRWTTHERALRERLGISLQETQLSDKLTVEETVALFRSFYRRGRTIDDTIAAVQLEEKRRGRVGQLSGGQKQRLALALALVNDPQLLFLDEPTTGLDPQVRLEIRDLIEQLRGENRTILLTTHYIEEAERLCDRVAIIDAGRIIAIGSPRALQEKSAEQSGIDITLSAALRPGDLPAWPEATHAVLSEDRRRLKVGSRKPARTLVEMVKWIEAQGLELEDVRLSRPTLEDVFIELTGKKLRD
jgi:ABC-2 type transport system ATP-binding protein